jgi:succinate-acetate transporter protein
MEKNTGETNNKIDNKDDNIKNIEICNNKDIEDNKEKNDIKRIIRICEPSESIKLKDCTNSTNNTNNNKNSNSNNIEKSDIHNLNNQEEKTPEIENDEENKKILKFFEKFEKKTIYTKNTRKYANSIPIGAFCNGISSILFGIFKSRLLVDEYTNVWSVLVLFGGLGQFTAGIMELIKGREFTSFLYIFYGIYCFTHYILRITTDRFGNFDLCIFFTAWLLLSIPIILYSIKSNLIFLLQTIFASLYFFFRCIGEGIKEDILIEQIASGFLILSGLCSLYIFLSQTINKYIINVYLKTFPFDSNNKIDFPLSNQNDKLHNN